MKKIIFIIIAISILNLSGCGIIYIPFPIKSDSDIYIFNHFERLPQASSSKSNHE